MLADTPMEQREQILRDNCDQIVERSYTRKFSAQELNQRRAEACDVANQIHELDERKANAMAQFKSERKPLEERYGKLLDEVKQRGEFCTGDCYKFVDPDEGNAGFYDPNGYLVEERPMTPEEKQRTLFQAIRHNGNDKTGTEG